MDTGFRSGGLQAAMRKAIEAALARRKSSTNFVSSFQIASFYAELGDKDQAHSIGSNTAYQERDNYLEALRTHLLDGLPALRSALLRTCPQNRFPAIAKLEPATEVFLGWRR